MPIVLQMEIPNFSRVRLFLSQHLVINSTNIQERDVSVACYDITLDIDHFDALM